jgi:hypothetical protein
MPVLPVLPTHNHCIVNNLVFDPYHGMEEVTGSIPVRSTNFLYILHHHLRPRAPSPGAARPPAPTPNGTWKRSPTRTPSTTPSAPSRLSATAPGSAPDPNFCQAPQLCSNHQNPHKHWRFLHKNSCAFTPHALSTIDTGIKKGCEPAQATRGPFLICLLPRGHSATPGRANCPCPHINHLSLATYHLPLFF